MATPQISLIFSFTGNVLVELPILGSNISVNWGSGYVSYPPGQPITGNPYGQIDIKGDITQFGFGSSQWLGAAGLSQVAGTLPTTLRSLSGAFNGAYGFDGLGISDWNLTNVTDMSYMFAGAKVDITNIGGLNVSNVETMAHMFSGASAFTGTGINAWDISGVTDMSYMFAGASMFNNTDISGWNVSNVKTMASMFNGASSFTGSYLDNWNVAAVEDMTNMFAGASLFNAPNIVVWNVGQVISMAGMFNGAASMYDISGAGLVDLSEWNVSSVVNHNLFLSYNSTDTSVSDPKSPFYVVGSLPVEPFSIDFETQPTLTTDWTNTQGYPAGTHFSAILIGQGSSNDAGGNGGGIQFSYTFLDDVSANSITIHIGTTGNTTGDFSSVSFSDMGTSYIVTAGGGTTDGGGAVTFTPGIDIQYLGSGSDIGNGYTAGGGPDIELIEYGMAGANSLGYASLDLCIPVTLPVTGIDASGLFVDFGPTQVLDQLSGLTSGRVNIYGNFSSFGFGTEQWPGVQYVTSFNNFGEANLTDVSGAFNGAIRLNTVLGSAISPASITDMSYMFNNASRLYDTSGNIKERLDWTVNNVTKSAFFLSSNGSTDTTRTDVLSPFYVSTLPPAMTMSFTAGTQVTLPISGIDTNGVIVNWYDGRGYLLYRNSAAITGTATTGKVDVSGQFTTFGLGEATWTGAFALLDVSGYPRGLTNLSGAFYTAAEFVGSTIHTWDLSGVTDMSYMFNGAAKFNNTGISAWNTSKVKNMSRMFAGARLFAGTGINAWDISGVTDMSSMFANANVFNNTGLGVWNTRNVKNMAGMFNNSNFTGVGINAWNVSAVTDMSLMFNSADNFNNTGLGAWNTSKVVNMAEMFRNTPFGGVGINVWDLSAVTDTSYMFANAYNFNNTGLGAWNTRNVKNMAAMFLNSNFTGVGINAWDVSGVTDMSFMFANASNFNNTGLGTWNTSNVKNMAGMFNDTNFTGVGINAWNVSAVTNMSSMFQSAGSFNNTGLGSWNTSNVVTMVNMFRDTPFTGIGIHNWFVSAVTAMSGMFYYAEVFNNSNLSNWERSGSTVGNVINMSTMFFGAFAMYDTSGNFKYNLRGWNVGSVMDKLNFMYSQFDTTLTDPKSPFYAPQPSMSLTFNNATVTLPLSGIDANGIDVNWNDNNGYIYYPQGSVISKSNVNGEVLISGKFTRFGLGSVKWQGVAQLSSVASIPSTVTDLSGAFNGVRTAFTPPASIPSSVTDMSWLFAESQLARNISGWDVSNVKNMSHMFEDYDGNVDISGWILTNATDVASMFAGAFNHSRSLTRWAYSLSPTVINTNFFTVDTFGCATLTNPTTDSENSPFYSFIPAPTNELFSSIGSFTSLPNPPFQLGSTVYGTTGTTLYKVTTDGTLYSVLQNLPGNPLGSLIGNVASFGQTVFGIISGTPAAMFYYKTAYGIVGTFQGTPNPSITYDAPGNLYATDSTGKIYKITATNTLTSSTSILTSIATTSPVITGPLSVSNNILSGPAGNGAIISVNLSTLQVTTTQQIPNARASSCLVDADKVYFYDVSGYSLNMYNVANQTRTLLWDFSGNPLRGTQPVSQISIDPIAQKLYGMCETDGPGLGNGIRGGGTVWSYALPAGPLVVLNSYVTGDAVRGSTPISYAITAEIGNASVVTQGGGFRPLFIAPRNTTYQVSQVLLPSYNVSCFNHGTKILSLVHGVDTWTQIQTLRSGDLVKTYKHGYRAIKNIGKGVLINDPNVWHSCMYKGQKEGYEPLIVTGGHAFLVDNLTLDEQERQTEFWGRGEEVIDDKLLMVAPVCKEFSPITTNEVFTYYHFTVENDGDDDRRYGVWANGFLTETPSVNQYNLHKYHSL